MFLFVFFDWIENNEIICVFEINVDFQTRSHLDKFYKRVKSSMNDSRNDDNLMEDEIDVFEYLAIFEDSIREVWTLLQNLFVLFRSTKEYKKFVKKEFTHKSRVHLTKISQKFKNSSKILKHFSKNDVNHEKAEKFTNNLTKVIDGKLNVINKKDNYNEKKEEKIHDSNGNDNENTKVKNNLTVEQVNSHGKTYTMSITPSAKTTSDLLEDRLKLGINNNSINNGDNNVEIEMASDITPEPPKIDQIDQIEIQTESQL